MKVRTRFVSNSSSSSFTCDVCKHTESGWDLGLEEAMMYECVNGHMFCESHANSINLEGLDTDVVLDLVAHREIWLSDEDRCELRGIEDPEEARDFILDHTDTCEWRYSIPSAFCPLCGMNDMSDVDLIAYLLKLVQRSRKDIVREAAERFGSYKRLKEYLNEKEEGIR